MFLLIPFWSPLFSSERWWNERVAKPIRFQKYFNLPDESYLYYYQSLLIATAASQPAIIALLFFFLQFKEFELCWSAVFFRICSHIFDFWSQIRIVILVTPKQNVERKSEWFCGMRLFRSNFKVESEKGTWTKFRFLASGFFCSHAAISLWCSVFSIFWIGFFF